MTIKNNKKRILGIAAMAMVTMVPIVTVISCNSKKTIKKEETTNETQNQNSNSTNISKDENSIETTTPLTYGQIIEKIMSKDNAEAKYRMSVGTPVTLATSKNNLAADADALATASRESSSNPGKWYENTVFPSTYQKEIGDYDFQSTKPETDKLISDAISAGKKIIITSLGKKDGLKTIDGKIAVLKDGRGYYKYVIILENKKTNTAKKISATKKTSVAKKVNIVKKTNTVKKANVATIDASKYKVELNLAKSNLEALIADATKTNIFVFDNNHGVQPIFKDTKKEYVSLIQSKLKEYGFKKDIYQQGYFSSAAKPTLFVGNTSFETIDEAIQNYEKVSGGFIKQVKVVDVVQQMTAKLKKEFAKYNLTSDFTVLDAYNNKLIANVVVPVHNQATADALVAKYITGKKAIMIQKKDFEKGSRSFPMSVKDLKSASGLNYFVTVGLMTAKKERINSKINSNTLVDGIQEIAFIKAGSGNRKIYGFTFVKFNNKWYFAADYVKSLFPGMTFKNDAYWKFDLNSIDAKNQDLLDYTKAVLQNASPVVTHPPVATNVTQGSNSKTTTHTPAPLTTEIDVLY